MVASPGTHVYCIQGTLPDRVSVRALGFKMAMIRTSTSKNPNVMHLIRLLFLTTARYDFIVKKAIADALS